MAQGPWFSLHLTDGDRSHIPNSQQELQYGYEPANQALTQKAYENIAKEIIKNAGGGKLEKGESESIFFGLQCLVSQNANFRLLFQEDQIPRIELLVPGVCDPGPLCLVLVAEARTRGLG